MVNKSCSLLLLTYLVNWPIQYMYSVLLCYYCHQHHHCHFICAVILAMSLKGATSFVAYILAYVPHKYIVCNLGVGIYVAFEGQRFSALW